MAKKKKSGSTKKKRSNKARMPPPDVDTVLERGDDAMNASDVQTALSLYTYASDQIRARIEGSAPTTVVEASEGDCGDDEAVEKGRLDVLLLSKVLGKCGEARISLGDQEGGREAFLDAITLLDCKDGEESLEEEQRTNGEEARTVADAQFCEAKAGLHLYLGQLSESAEALAHYKYGVAELGRCVSILEALANSGKNIGGSDSMEEDGGSGMMESALVETRRQLCGAHCSVAELYLTDLCFDPEAEAQCEVSLQAALELDDGKGSPDALQGMANLRLSQGRGADATKYILDTYSRMIVGCEAMADLVGLGKESDDEKEKNEDIEKKAKELVDVEAATSLPIFDFRCQTAKILLECSAFLDDYSGKAADNTSTSKEREKGLFCAEAAIQVLGSLLAENDEVIEVWYLLGCAFAASGPPNNDAAQYYWEKTMEMLLKAKQSFDQELSMAPDTLKDEEFTSQLGAIAAQIKEVQEKLAGIRGCKEDVSPATERKMEITES